MLLNETVWHAPALALFIGEPAVEIDQVSDDSTIPLPVPAEMLELFEQLTGWVVGFSETRASYQIRQLKPASPTPAEGQFSVVDMSADWPAGRPAAHRAKCDRFIELFNDLVQEFQQTKSDLITSQSKLAAYSPSAIDDDEAELFDCFIPRYESQPTGAGKAVVDFIGEPESDFEIGSGMDGVELLPVSSTPSSDPITIAPESKSVTTDPSCNSSVDDPAARLERVVEEMLRHLADDSPDP